MGDIRPRSPTSRPAGKAGSVAKLLKTAPPRGHVGGHAVNGGYSRSFGSRPRRVDPIPAAAQHLPPRSEAATRGGRKGRVVMAGTGGSANGLAAWCCRWMASVGAQPGV